MEGTQRSQPISTENREIARNSGEESGSMPMADPQADDVPRLYGESSLAEIRRLAIGNPDLVFTSLAHRIDFHLLRKSFGEIRKSRAAGVDGMTAAEYARNLDQNPL